ncbi:nuclear transport factor 2 family protein [Mesorhizobium sp.]|uniref:YybH family protein n=1 Tax=Mesorhizobium sp. TaxID=1871066 RepID=UPI0012217C48|nr:nuclear transport factor 2 family protein [Mesorhizobium sp.]TIS55800.1 MAG: nuclear transport factor 2 family protein [Mesorhizobium sp.]TIS89800.1 MAG: nuclear transport factor 2 family protein [Mesorhizobium sp.]
MTDARTVVQRMCERYQAAVNANDSKAYGALFAADGIRVPPGAEPEHGPEAIAASEQKDYDVAAWTITSRPLDALKIDDDWVYGLAEASVNTVAHGDGAETSFKVTKSWLIHREGDEWLIKRHLWNTK